MSLSQIIALAVALLALLVSAFVSGSEISFFSIGAQTREELEESSSGRKVNRLLEKPEKLLATILITNNLVNVTIVVLCNFALGPVFTGMPSWLSFVLQTVILTFLILLFGEILPKIYANNFPVQWARFASGGIAFLVKLFSPLSSMMVRSTRIVRKVVTKQPKNITADELSTALEITDVKAGDQKDMLEGILKFGDTTAEEIMTPRTEVTDLELDMDFDEVMKIVIESGYSRLPVCDRSLDNIKGILYSRDLLPYIDNRTTTTEGADAPGSKHVAAKPISWQSLVRKPYFVPGAKRIDDLLEDFRRLKMHLAIVVDEYGGTQGIVSLEDVLEEIVGDISDEYDEDETTFRRLPDNSFIFDGKTLLTDFFRITGLDEDDYKDVTDDAETLAGMILTIKGDFPAAKETLVYGRCRFLVLEISEHRVAKVKVTILPLAEDNSAKE